jgi:hypothetical protein
MEKRPFTITLAALSVAWAFSGLHAENVITMGYGEGAPGSHGIEVIVTATNDAAIHGYSLAFTYPTEALSLAGISLLGTHIMGGANPLDPEFVAPSLDNTLGVGVLGVIFDFTEPVALKELPPTAQGGYPRILARLIFDVKSTAKGGIYPLQLKDGIGRPANFNRFTRAGTSIKPHLENGRFVVTSLGNVLTLDEKRAFAGATSNLPIFASVQHSDDLAGFQVAITYDKQAVTLTGATFSGTDLGFELTPSQIEAYNFDIDLNFSATQGRAATAVLFDFAPPFDGQVLRAPSVPNTPQRIMKYSWNVGATADDAKEWQDLRLDDADIPGAIDNRFIIGDASLSPIRNHGKIYFSDGNLTGTVIDTDTLRGVGGVQVSTDPDGFKATTQVNGNFRFDAIIPGTYTLILTRQDYYTNRLSKTEAGAEITVAGKGADASVGRIPMYRIPSSVGTKKFLRGYVNVDAKVDLSDSVTILLYLFQGSNRPGCLLAADTNDDNRLDLSDAVYMLNYLFGGKAPPPPPFSTTRTNCGLDPTPGGVLDCQEFNCP